MSIARAFAEVKALQDILVLSIPVQIRALVLLMPFIAGLGGLIALANAQSTPTNYKPDLPPSYTVHISPSGNDLEGGNLSGPDYWSLKAIDIKSLLKEVTGVNRIRMELPPMLDNDKPYDFTIVLPGPESRESMAHRIEQGAEDYFHIALTRESRMSDVYVISASRKKPPSFRKSSPVDSPAISVLFSIPVRNSSSSGTSSLSGPPAVPIEAVSTISIDGGTDDFCHLLESELDRPVVNETNLTGSFRFNVRQGKSTSSDFVQRLHDQLGLVVTRAQRQVEMFVWRSV